MARIIITAAGHDFDPSEVAVPWSILDAAGHEVRFATPHGIRAHADELMVTGQGLDPWGFIPGLRRLTVAGAMLRANGAASAAYARLVRAPSFLSPHRYADLRAGDWDALMLPGGHRARGIRPYLEDRTLHAFVASMFDADKPVGAICHGTVVAARSVSPKTGRSVLHGRKTTSLTWKQEKLAWSLARITRFWDPNYYRTYLEGPGEPEGYWSVEAEVTRALASPSDYRDVARTEPFYRLKTDGLHRDSATDERPAFVVRDGSYVSARWPGDVHTFTKVLDQVIAERESGVARTPT